MNSKLLQLNDIWRSVNNYKATDRDIFLFEEKYGLLIPDDLIDYFKILNGTSEEYDAKFFQFNSLNDFKKIDEAFKEWKGVPNYQKIRETFDYRDTTFIFADFQICLFSYGIQLYKNKPGRNEIYAFCGDEYRVIAYSFTEFLDLYFSESIKLQF
jgi:hypothetical protein